MSLGQSEMNAVLENDNFERDLQEMLEDNPSDGDIGTTVSNTSQSETSQNVPFSQPPTSLPLSQNNVVPPANTNVPLTTPSPSQNGEDYNRNPCGVNRIPPSKIDSLKQWSISTYKCTRQILSEKLGKVSRTVDSEMEAQIEILRDTQKKYANILRLSRALTSHFYHMVQTQTALAESFSELAQKSPQLQDEFLYNSETQRNISKNGETLLGALNFFVSTVNTLCNKTMEDTLQTVKQYETARIEFDAYRSDLEIMKDGPRADLTKIEDAQRSFNAHKEKFDRLRADVNVKLKFLEENKVKVMHKQLLLFHNAISAYFSGNQAALEATLKQFSIKMKNPNASSPSWLEQ